MSGAITLFSQALPERFIGNQELNGSRQCSSVACRKQKPVLLVRDHLGDRTGVRGNHSGLREHGLDDRESKGFPIGRHHHDVGGP